MLILGSMPGVASLEAVQYYAFERNVFWRIMGDIYSAGPEMAYQQRLGVLLANHIALWDVIGTCHRPGSLDSAISNDRLEINDFARFFKQHPQIFQICFNGQKAAKLFRKKVLPDLSGQFKYVTLPSTSPAYAARNYASKLEAWSVIRNGVSPDHRE